MQFRVGGTDECGLDPAAEAVDPDAHGFARGGRLSPDQVPERPAAASAAITLPDRVTVQTCIGCGAMGREERCDGDCSEHKFMLVTAADYDELRDASHAAWVRAARMVAVVREFADADAQPHDPRDAPLKDARKRPSSAARRRTRRGSHRLGLARHRYRLVVRAVWQRRHAPAVHRGLSLASGGLGQPGPVRPSARAGRPGLRAARSLTGFLARVAAVTPRAGQWRRNREALQAQARAALRDFAPDSPRTRVPVGRRAAARPRPSHTGLSLAALTPRQRAADARLRREGRPGLRFAVRSAVRPRAWAVRS